MVANAFWYLRVYLYTWIVGNFRGKFTVNHFSSIREIFLPRNRFAIEYIIHCCGGCGFVVVVAHYGRGISTCYTCLNMWDMTFDPDWQHTLMVDYCAGS